MKNPQDFSQLPNGADGQVFIYLDNNIATELKTKPLNSKFPDVVQAARSLAKVAFLRTGESGLHKFVLFPTSFKELKDHKVSDCSLDFTGMVCGHYIPEGFSHAPNGIINAHENYMGWMSKNFSLIQDYLGVGELISIDRLLLAKKLSLKFGIDSKKATQFFDEIYKKTPGFIPMSIVATNNKPSNKKPIDILSFAMSIPGEDILKVFLLYFLMMIYQEPKNDCNFPLDGEKSANSSRIASAIKDFSYIYQIVYRSLQDGGECLLLTNDKGLLRKASVIFYVFKVNAKARNFDVKSYIDSVSTDFLESRSPSLVRIQNYIKDNMILSS